MIRKLLLCIVIMLLVPVASKAQWPGDPASLEAMIANHRTVRLALELRLTTEMGLHALQDSTHQKVVKYESVCKWIDKYNRGMSWINNLLQGASQVVHFGNTFKETTRCLEDYVKLMDDYRAEFLTGIDPSNVKVIKEDSILLTTSYELYKSLVPQCKELYNSLELLIPLVVATSTGVTQVKISEMLVMMDRVNDNMDMIASTVGSAYYRLYSYMMLRRGYWKHGIFPRRTMKEIVDEAAGSWERAQQAAAQVIINQQPMDFHKVLGGGGLLGERKRQIQSI